MSTLEDLFGAGLLPKTDFPPESRYHGVETRVIELTHGRTVAYLARRLVPSPDGFATVSVHRVQQGERLDRISAELTGNAEQFWLLCDANGAIWPAELERTESAMRVTRPAGLDAGDVGE
jgi:hypothetical protein